MAKMSAAKKKAFIARMKAGRKAAASGGKKKASKKKASKKKASKKKASKKKGGKKKASKPRKPAGVSQAQWDAWCGERMGKKSRKGKKKGSSKKKASKRKGSKRRCNPCAGDIEVTKRMGKSRVKNISCVIANVNGSCRQICFSTVGKTHTKSGGYNFKAKRYLLSNQPARGCRKPKGGKAVPSILLRGIIGL